MICSRQGAIWSFVWIEDWMWGVLHSGLVSLVLYVCLHEVLTSWHTENSYAKYTKNPHVKYTENPHVEYTENPHVKYTENSHVKYTENSYAKYTENSHAK